MPRIRRDADGTPFGLITRLFVRRLIDNDLISPHADRHESLAVLGGLIVSIAVFAIFFLSMNYLAAFIQLPGPAALSALSDRFLLIAASMTISALGAAIVWDALAVEPRDAAVLGPLPVSAGTITRAKLAAAMLFGAALTIGLNAVPSVLYPAFLTVNIRGTRGSTILRLMAAHAATVTAAGLFGFFVIVATRGTLRLLLREPSFRRTSSAVQSALVVGLMTALLLSPTVRAGEVAEWVDHIRAPGWAVRPVLWYLGMNETLAGQLVAATPLVAPPRVFLTRRLVEENRIARARYRALQPRFAALARRAWLSVPLAATLALTTFLWTNRRLPDRSAAAPAPSRIAARARRFLEERTQRDPEAQAGFFFALQTLSRSAPHRTIVAIAVALGLTHALIALAQSGGRRFDGQSNRGAFAIAVMLEMALLSGIRYAATVPAELASNWTIRIAWCGDERGYLRGVKRAALLAAAAPLIVLLPLHVALFGTVVALAHSIFVLLLAAAALEVLFLSYRNLPFACSYVPIENPKLAWPAGLASLLLVTYGFAAIERWALEHATRAGAFGLALTAAVFFTRSIDRARRRERWPVAFDNRPAMPTQRLGLLEHVTIDSR